MTEMRKNKGDSRCVDFTFLEMTVTQLGCENVHLRCDATEVKYTLETLAKLSKGAHVAFRENYQDAEICLAEKCGGLPSQVARERHRKKQKELKSKVKNWVEPSDAEFAESLRRQRQQEA